MRIRPRASSAAAIRVARSAASSANSSSNGSAGGVDPAHSLAAGSSKGSGTGTPSSHGADVRADGGNSKRAVGASVLAAATRRQQERAQQQQQQQHYLLPRIRPPHVAQPDLAISRFFAAHRPLLDIELLEPQMRSRTRASDSGGAVLTPDEAARRSEDSFSTQTYAAQAVADGDDSAHRKAERSIVIPTALLRRRLRQPITLDRFAKLLDELSPGLDRSTGTAANENASGSRTASRQRPRPSSASSSTKTLSVAKSISASTPRRRSGARSGLRTATKSKRERQQPSPRVLSAAIKLLAHDAYLTSRASAVSRAVERGENPSLAQKLGVESELVILGEQSGPSPEWARGVALWLAEHGRAYLPPPPPTKPSGPSPDLPPSIPSSSLDSEGNRPSTDDAEIVVLDTDTFVNVSLMDAENALVNGLSERDITIEPIDLDPNHGAHTADLPPADPNLLLSHALVQARLADSLRSAHVLGMLEDALRKSHADTQSGSGAAKGPASTSTPTPVPAPHLSVPLDLSTLNADISDVRMPALRARVRRLLSSRRAAAAAGANAAAGEQPGGAASAPPFLEFPVRSGGGAGARSTRGRRMHGGRRARAGAALATAHDGVVRTGSKELEVRSRALNEGKLDGADDSAVGFFTAARLGSVLDSAAPGTPELEFLAGLKGQGQKDTSGGHAKSFEETKQERQQAQPRQEQGQQQQQKLKRARARKARLDVVRARKSEVE